MKLCQLITNQRYFIFDNFYKEKIGLPMGSLSGILASLFLEFLESGSFRNVLLQNSSYFRYTNNIILPDPVNKHNYIECIIDFTFET